MVKGKQLVPYRSHREDRARLQLFSEGDPFRPAPTVLRRQFTAAAPPRVLTEQDFCQAATSLSCEVAVLKAVAEVETCGSGFLADGQLRVLFEGHVFYRYTNGVFAPSFPTLCYPTWTTANYCRGDAETRGHGELERLEQAKKLDKKAALMSCSIGRFQVMGFNFSLCGFKSVEDFWTSLAKGEQTHLSAFCRYVQAMSLDKVLRRRSWAAFAKAYNGPDYRRNRYESKLAEAYARFSNDAPPA